MSFASAASKLYGAVVACRNLTFDRGLRRARRLPGVTISVGNLAAGGTGKSPFVIFLARYLKSKGARPAILTRGYRSGLAARDSMVLLGTERVVAPRLSRTVHADEAQMQAATLADVPVIVGARRYEAAKRFLKERPDLSPSHWLLDDGFQRRQIARDVDIVLLDARDPFAGDALLPVGRLREPLDALARADLVVFTRAGNGHPTKEAREKVRRYTTAMQVEAPFRSSELRPIGGAFALTRPDGPVYATCAIAHPERFFRSLEDLGLRLGGRRAAADHTLMDPPWEAAKAAGCVAVVTTAKDYWRDPGLFADPPLPVYVTDVAIELSPGELEQIFARFEKDFFPQR